MKKVTSQIAKAFNYVLYFHPSITKMKLNIADGWEFDGIDIFDEQIDTKVLKDAVDSLYNEYDKDTMTFTKRDVKMFDGWSCTDSDNQQYCFQVNENVFIYREYDALGAFLNERDVPNRITRSMWEDSSNWYEAVIDFRELTEKDINSTVSAYYDSIDEVKEIYGDNWKQIVAECYFEQNYSGY